MSPPRPHWTPTSQYVRESGYDAFRRYLNQRQGTDFKPTDYWSLHAWVVLSAENNNTFWTALWEFGGVIGEKGLTPVSDICEGFMR
jgi:acetoacetyl-CoA synthetase